MTEKYRTYPVRRELNDDGPPVWGQCDISGIMVPRDQLMRQLIQAGDDVVWNGLWVYEDFLDPLDEQKKIPKTAGDPRPVKDARPTAYPINTLVRKNEIYPDPTIQGPLSSQGDATGCFVDDGNGLSQSEFNGWIGFKYNDPIALSNIGVETFLCETYHLFVDASNDDTWIPLADLGEQQYAPFDEKLFDIQPLQLYTKYRIRGVGGNRLSIYQLYFYVNE